ncbi:DNA-directed RNA polymerase III subunit RPC8 [Clonorchis sinensis]|uniref:DNA-directed RNA polymerase III subunit RPC8 n=1 Tax=Clonorchis sinensis TaxID=79923 RepID=G7Y8U1_CLOSI|nr:DNA-directed RNA polymerase III subunit RPC8 [Clonorchis sinensis]
MRFSPIFPASMFILAKLEDTVVIHPKYFGTDLKETIEHELNARFANKLVYKVGLCISLWDLLEVQESFISDVDGAYHTAGLYPSGQITPSFEIVILEFHLPSPLFPSSDYEQSSWIWEYDYEGETAELRIDKNDTIRSFVRLFGGGVRWLEQPSTKQQRLGLEHALESVRTFETPLRQIITIKWLSVNAFFDSWVCFRVVEEIWQDPNPDGSKTLPGATQEPSEVADSLNEDQFSHNVAYTIIPRCTERTSLLRGLFCDINVIVNIAVMYVDLRLFGYSDSLTVTERHPCAVQPNRLYGRLPTATLY